MIFSVYLMSRKNKVEEFHTDDQKAILNLVDFCWTFGIKFNLFNSSHFIQFFVPCEQKQDSKELSPRSLERLLKRQLKILKIPLGLKILLIFKILLRLKYSFKLLSTI